MPLSSREWHLAARPAGEPKPSDFAFVTTAVPDRARGRWSYATTSFPSIPTCGAG